MNFGMHEHVTVILIANEERSAHTTIQKVTSHQQLRETNSLAQAGGDAKPKTTAKTKPKAKAKATAQSAVVETTG